MPSPNTSTRRQNEPTRRFSYLGPYRTVLSDDGTHAKTIRDFHQGQRITARDGTKYIVMEAGNLRRALKPPSRRDRTRHSGAALAHETMLDQLREREQFS